MWIFDNYQISKLSNYQIEKTAGNRLKLSKKYHEIRNSSKLQASGFPRFVG
jgi:hypothetical protein